MRVLSPIFTVILISCASLGGLNEAELTEQGRYDYRTCREGSADACNSFAYNVFDDQTLGASWKQEAMRIVESGCREKKAPQLCVHLGFRYQKENRRAEAMALFLAACRDSTWDCAPAAGLASEANAPISAEDRAWLVGRVQEICAANANERVCTEKEKLEIVAGGRDLDETTCERHGEGCARVADRYVIQGRPVPDAVWNSSVRGCADTGACYDAVSIARVTGRELPDSAWSRVWGACIYRDECTLALPLWKAELRPKGAALDALRVSIQRELEECKNLRKSCERQLQSCDRQVRQCRLSREWYSEGIVVAQDEKRAQEAYAVACPKSDSPKKDPLCKRTFFPFKGEFRSFSSGPCATRPGENALDVSSLRANVMQTAIEPERRYLAAKALHDRCKEYDPPAACEKVPEKFFEEMKAHSTKALEKVGLPPCRVASKGMRKSTIFCPPGHLCIDAAGNRYDGNEKTIHEGPMESFSSDSTCTTPELRKAYAEYLEKMRELPKILRETWEGLSFDLCAAP